MRNDLRKERRIKKTGGGTGSDGQVTLLRVRDGQSSMGKHTLPTLGPKKDGGQQKHRAARDRAADTDDKAELKRAGSEG